MAAAAIFLYGCAGVGEDKHQALEQFVVSVVNVYMYCWCVRVRVFIFYFLSYAVLLILLPYSPLPNLTYYSCYCS